MSTPTVKLSDLSGRVALVTGAARGIGRAVALRLAKHGADLVLLDLGDADADAELATLSAAIAAAGGRSLCVAADVSRQAEVQQAVARGVAHFSRVDILVNNAAIHAYPSPLLTVTEHDWDQVMAINLKGALFTCQAVVPHMVRNGAGSVINIISDSAFDVIADEGPYGISKIGLARLSSYLAKELAGTGVRVNSLAPGWVKTRLTEFATNDLAVLGAALESIPARRFAEPDDIAGVVLFLASDLANYVNGHCIVVDGGRVAGLPALAGRPGAALAPLHFAVRYQHRHVLEVRAEIEVNSHALAEVGHVAAGQLEAGAAVHPNLDAAGGDHQELVEGIGEGVPAGFPEGGGHAAPVGRAVDDGLLAAKLGEGGPLEVRRPAVGDHGRRLDRGRCHALQGAKGRQGQESCPGGLKAECVHGAAPWGCPILGR